MLTSTFGFAFSQDPGTFETYKVGSEDSDFIKTYEVPDGKIWSIEDIDEEASVIFNGITVTKAGEYAVEINLIDTDNSIFASLPIYLTAGTTIIVYCYAGKYVWISEYVSEY